MIFTFYSYKGGVGRSMALANIAELLYEKGNSVLMIDWDLDSPGLETFFPDISQKARENPGLLNMLLHYKTIFSQYDFLEKKYFKITSKSLISLGREKIPKDLLIQLEVLKDAEYPAEKEFLKALETILGTKRTEQYKSVILKHALQLQIGNIQDYIVDVYSESGKNGRNFLKLLSAGKRDDSSFGEYTTLFKSFDWQDFYENWAGEQYFEWFRRQIENIAPIILIDSRNGVNEMSGVCTYQMADVVIAFTSSNDQSIEGTEKIVNQLRSSELQKLRPERSKLGVVVVPARVEQTELVARNKFEEEFKKNFDNLLPENWVTNKRSFWDLRIPYVPLYAYKEIVAVREKKGKRELTAQELVEAYEKIWEAMKDKASPPGEEPWRWRYETGKVIIIENIPAWQDVLKEIVKSKIGESYELAINQESAKNLLTNREYNLIILNLNLSSSGLDSGIGYEGFDILDFLKATGRTIPVLLLSSEVISTRDIFDTYPNVKDIFFKGAGESLAKALSESIRKHLDNQ